jgi:hypothetical protein
MEKSVARFTARFPNSEVVLLVLLVNHVFFSSELRQCSQSAQTSDLLTIGNAGLWFHIALSLACFLLRFNHHRLIVG